MNVKNKKYIRRLSFRTLWASRRRNVIAVFAIALTTLMFTTLFTVAMSINSSYQTYVFHEVGGYSHGTFKNVSDDQAKAIAGHPKVKAVGERKVIGISSDGVFAKVPAEISYMDDNCTEWSYALPTVGHMPQSGKEVSMDTAALALLGVEPKLGAEVTLTYDIADKNQTLYPKTDTFTLVGWWEYSDISPVHYINISEEYAKEIEAEGVAAGMDAFRTDLNVMMASSVDIRGQMEQVDTDLGYTWESYNEENSVRIGVNWGYTSAQLGESIDAQAILAIAAFLALVIFTGYLIIYNIFQISVSGDIRFYGLLKTIGVTPRQLRKIIRWQALLLCIAGIPLGLIPGYGVGAILTPVVMARTTFGASVSTVSISPLIFIASALFSLATVLLSCSRPGRIAGKVSPIEATKYTEVTHISRKSRRTRGAKVHQMAFANLGRNKSKTSLVVVSLSLSVILLNILVVFVSGFDMEKYLEKKTCSDFIVSSTDYFRYSMNADEYIPEAMITDIEANTSQTTAGCAYTSGGTVRPLTWISEEAWKNNYGRYASDELVEALLNSTLRREDLVSVNFMIEGLDEALFDKLTVLDGDLDSLLSENSRTIALSLSTNDYGVPYIPQDLPALGDTVTVTYVQDAYYIDTRTGEKRDENTPAEYQKLYITGSQDVDYIVGAYVTVPYSMSYRYSLSGCNYEAILPADRLAADSGLELKPLLYLFDTPDINAENAAELYLAELAGRDLSGMMYESKASTRADFESFRNMFILLGGLLCAIIGLVGVLNFFNAIITGILSRGREFAVLQSVGMTNKQLKNMLIYEGLFYAVGSAATALILSILLTPLVGNLLESMFWFIDAGFTIVPALAAVPVFALLGWLIPSVIYGRATKQSIVERLRSACD